MQAIDALGPVFLLVVIGTLLRRWNMPGGEFWTLAERLTYYLFFPALLVHTLATASFTARDLGAVFFVVMILMMSVATVLLLSARWLATDNAAFTSVFQGSLRFNTYVGLAAASGLWGETGLSIAAVAVACMVPLVNLLCIAVFAWKGDRSGCLAQQVALNPLILACVLGICLNLTGIGLPFWSESTLEILGRPALPLGLLAIGVGLSFGSMRSAPRPLLVSSTIKLLLMPCLAALLCRILELETPYFEVLVLFFAIPTASSAYILARQLGGDAPLMAAIITFQTVAAMLTLPLILGLLLATAGGAG
ncbi:MAG: AEC family transporter [Pseudomonadota bacterium]